MNKPMLDYTMLVAVESLFRPGKRDPWGLQLAGELTDLFVYGDIVRYAVAVAMPREEGPPEEPSLVAALHKRDPAVIKTQTYSSAEPRVLDNQYLHEAFDGFDAWARSNPHTLERWIALHNQEWVRSFHTAHMKHRYVFALEELRNEPTLKALAQKVELEQSEICYAFDTVLKYPLIGEIAGEGEYYLSHPIRTGVPLPTMEVQSESRTAFAVSWASGVKDLIKSKRLSQDQYTVLLHELRGYCREQRLHKMSPGQVDKEVIREIAAKIQLRPQLKSITKAALFGGNGIRSLAAYAALGPTAVITGAAVSVSPALFTGKLPRRAARVGWLRRMIKWDVEDQVEKRE
ncbi:MAG: hypothetical protein JOZ57_04250 [Abitibacteriaceae bacterium]|nr:hypothetical protein [Abditibacteriaceae bacterium]